MKPPFLTLALVVLIAAPGSAQQPPAASGMTKAAVEKIGDGKYRIGAMQVDTVKREVTVPAGINPVENVEFTASARNGVKSYETLLILNTDAVEFNTALLLIGLDPARGKPSKMQFDKDTPEGDAVELFVDMADGQRLRVEELLYDKGLKQPLASGPWVYTGSTFIPGMNGPRYLAEIDGVLVGLMHGPSAIIENPRNDQVARFGNIIPNPKFVKTQTYASFVVRALPLPGRPKLK